MCNPRTRQAKTEGPHKYLASLVYLPTSRPAHGYIPSPWFRETTETRGKRDGSMIKNTCSSTRPKFKPQYPHSSVTPVPWGSTPSSGLFEDPLYYTKYLKIQTKSTVACLTHSKKGHYCRTSLPWDVFRKKCLSFFPRQHNRCPHGSTKSSFN